MFKHLFDNAQNLAAYPAFTLLVFFLFFVGVAIWVVKIDKREVEKISRLPLDEKDGKILES